MLKLSQSVIALITAAACVIALSSPTEPITRSAPAPEPILAAAFPAAEGPATPPDDLVAYIAPTAVPLDTPEPRLAPHSEPRAILAGASAPEPGRFVTIDALLTAAAVVGWQTSPTLAVVARCESGVDLDYDGVKEAVDVRAINPVGGDRGPLQINPVHALPGGLVAKMGYQWDDMLSLVPNLVVGLAIYEAAGDFTPWACKP